MTIPWAVLFWTFLGFFLGSLPFSVWLGDWRLGLDIRRTGDGNPGAANAWRAGGWRIGLAAVLLDALKGTIPILLARWSGSVTDLAWIPVALAPVAGHAFTPVLGFRGGKTLAVSFGVWTGLLAPIGPVALGLLMGLFYFTVRPDAWAAVLGMGAFLLSLFVREMPVQIPLIAAGNFTLLAWKHRNGLKQKPAISLRISGRRGANE